MIMNQMISGTKTVLGEIVASGGYLEVSGLPFRPKGIMAAAYPVPSSTPDAVWYLADQNTGTSLGSARTYKLRNATLTITSNSIKISGATSDVGPKTFYGTYRYIVWG